MTPFGMVHFMVALSAVTGKIIGSSSSNTLHDIPDPKDVALMARYIVHNSNWTSVAYISHARETKGSPMGALFAVSDGPVGRGTGVPYFYVSRLQDAVSDLMDNNHTCSLTMSLAQSQYCNDRNLDPEDPRCAHTVITGVFQKISNASAEYPVARAAVFSRHPSFIHLPESHHFFIAKLNITRITVQDMFGGPSVVPVSDYFHVENKSQNLASKASRSGTIKIQLCTLSLLLGLMYTSETS